MALELLCRFETHQPLLDAKVKIDFMFAIPELDEKTGKPKGDAIKKNGVKALGLCRIVSLKERAMGRADAEITLDQYWWESAIEPEQQALLDHELHHIGLKLEHNMPVLDDIGRPIIKLRTHDFEVGWFAVVAARHGNNSQERIQARKAMTNLGQYFWPDIFGEPLSQPKSDDTKIVISTGDKKVETTLGGLKRAADAAASGELSDEALIEQCIEVIRSEQKASVSLLQRRLRLGYTRASNIMDELERRGIVGPSNGTEPRNIIVAVN